MPCLRAAFRTFHRASVNQIGDQARLFPHQSSVYLLNNLNRHVTHFAVSLYRHLIRFKTEAIEWCDH